MELSFSAVTVCQVKSSHGCIYRPTCILDTSMKDFPQLTKAEKSRLLVAACEKHPLDTKSEEVDGDNNELTLVVAFLSRDKSFRKDFWNQLVIFCKMN